jgi:hypothetical protein
MNHDAVIGHQLVGAGCAGDQTLNIVGGKVIVGQTADGFSGQLGVGVRDFTCQWVNRVMPGLYAIVAQHDAAGARGFAADHAEYILDIVVADRRVGQKDRRAIDVDLAARVHVFVG